MKSCAVMLDVTSAVINTNADSDCIKKLTFLNFFFFYNGFTMAQVTVFQTKNKMQYITIEPLYES